MRSSSCKAVLSSLLLAWCGDAAINGQCGVDTEAVCNDGVAMMQTRTVEATTFEQRATLKKQSDQLHTLEEERVPTNSTSTCSANPRCAALGLIGECCPTGDNVTLECCAAEDPESYPENPVNHPTKRPEYHPEKPERPPKDPGHHPGYQPADGRLLQSSPATRRTFYMYRVQNDEDYPPENQNMANLAGALWYLHNEIVNNKGARRFQKTRIQRFKVKTQATKPMLDDGIHWGVRYAYDKGQCTGPWNCSKAFAKYGYFVGCNNVDEFPTQQWKNKVFYPNAIWYSLPGKCSTQQVWDKTAECQVNEPGGACDDVNGMGNCTYSYWPAGEISIDELEGIDDFQAFARAGGWEYNNQTDKGVHMTFWNNKYSTSACKERLDRARSVFREKYKDQPFEELQEPRCDFNFNKFYAHVQKH